MFCNHYICYYRFKLICDFNFVNSHSVLLLSKLRGVLPPNNSVLLRRSQLRPVSSIHVEWLHGKQEQLRNSPGMRGNVSLNKMSKRQHWYIIRKETASRQCAISFYKIETNRNGKKVILYYKI